jgi:hypothetical protein
MTNGAAALFIRTAYQNAAIYFGDTPLDEVLKDGELPALSKGARRHELVLNELLRRPNNG